MLLYPRREVGRALCPEPSVEKLENIWMHMWRWWTAKNCKVNRYSINKHIKINELNVFIIEIVIFLFRQKSRNSETDAAGYF